MYAQVFFCLFSSPKCCVGQGPSVQCFFMKVDRLKENLDFFEMEECRGDKNCLNWVLKIILLCPKLKWFFWHFLIASVIEPLYFAKMGQYYVTTVFLYFNFFQNFFEPGRSLLVKDLMYPKLIQPKSCYWLILAPSLAFIWFT